MERGFAGTLGRRRPSMPIQPGRAPLAVWIWPGTFGSGAWIGLGIWMQRAQPRIQPVRRPGKITSCTAAAGMSPSHPTSARQPAAAAIRGSSKTTSDFDSSALRFRQVHSVRTQSAAARIPGTPCRPAVQTMILKGKARLGCARPMMKQKGPSLDNKGSCTRGDHFSKFSRPTYTDEQQRNHVPHAAAEWPQAVIAQCARDGWSDASESGQAVES